MKVCVKAFPDNYGPVRTIEFHDCREYVILTMPEDADGLTSIYEISKLEWARLLKAGTGFLVKEE